jgi:hypothetical protein
VYQSGKGEPVAPVTRLVLATRWRYCSTHWFIHSESPSVWGWKAVDRFQSMGRCWASALAKCNVKRGSQSDIILVGRLNHWYTCLKYNSAIPVAPIVVMQGRKSAAQEQPWSAMVRIASYPLLLGSCVIRSIATCWKGFVAGGVGMR